MSPSEEYVELRVTLIPSDGSQPKVKHFHLRMQSRPAVGDRIEFPLNKLDMFGTVTGVGFRVRPDDPSHVSRDGTGGSLGVVVDARADL